MSNATPNRARRLADPVHRAPRPLGAQAHEPLLGRQLGERVALLAHDVGRVRLDVLAVVAVLGHLGVAAERLEVARLDRGAEPVHLPAGVVEVVLALHRVARGLEQPRDRVTEDGVARVADVQRPRRVRAHELHLDALAGGWRVAEPRALGGDGPHRVEQPIVGRPHVDEPRPGDLDLLDERRRREDGHQRLGHLSRRYAGALGKGQRHVRREVAVVLLPGLLELRLGQVAVEPEPRRCGSQPVAEPRAQLVFDQPGPPSSERAHGRHEVNRVERLLDVALGLTGGGVIAPPSREEDHRHFGVAGSARSRCRISRPSIPGSIRSRTMTSGVVCATTASASSPCDAASTSKPSIRKFTSSSREDRRVVVDEQDARHAREHTGSRRRGRC